MILCHILCWLRTVCLSELQVGVRAVQRVSLPRAQLAALARCTRRSRPVHICVLKTKPQCIQNILVHE